MEDPRLNGILWRFDHLVRAFMRRGTAESPSSWSIRLGLGAGAELIPRVLDRHRFIRSINKLDRKTSPHLVERTVPLTNDRAYPSKLRNLREISFRVLMDVMHPRLAAPTFRSADDEECTCLPSSRNLVKTLLTT